MIEIISEGLGKDLIDNIIFVGGSVTGFYSTDKAPPEIRYTEDVDCIVKINVRTDFNIFESELRKRKFQNDIRKNAPICRWVYSGVTVDIMPPDSKIFGFSNPWYINGINNTIKFKINEKLEINIFPAPYFIATKIEAKNNRSGSDIRFSHDFEDIVFVLNNRNEIIEEIENTDNEVKNFIKSDFNKLISYSYIDEAIECVLPYGSGNKTIHKIKNIMKKIIINP